MGLEAIGVVPVVVKDVCDWVKGCTVLEVEGPRPRGRQKKTWMEVVKRDMKETSSFTSNIIVCTKSKTGFTSAEMLFCNSSNASRTSSSDLIA